MFLIKGVAKGIKKPKSKLGARMDLLVANSLQLLKGRSMDTILQAQTVNHFRKTREDVQLLQAIWNECYCERSGR